MTGPLWQGRFSKGPSEALAELSRSIQFDQRLWPYDIAATRAHAGNLQRAGLISEQDEAELGRALDGAAREFREGSFRFDPSDEDIHSALERYLTDRLGDLGARIHAGRSRNDLVVTDLRLWLKDAIPAIAQGVLGLEEALLKQAADHPDALAPGYTHLQRAQPVLLAHHLLAHAFALARDFDRLKGAYRRADVSGLGAAAFAGTTLPLDPAGTAAKLGFAGVFDNSADAVGSRDFALEFLAAAAILAVQLSRIGEEIVLWTSSEFGFATLDDAFATGSSIMPQKKNPDVAELVRGKSGRVIGDLVHLLAVVKGLPMAYNRDLQEDKEPVFDAADSVGLCLAALTGTLATLTFNEQRLEEAARAGPAGATDLAEGLVKQGVPFRHAHEAVGKLVAVAAARGKELSDLTEAELAEAHPALNTGMLELLDARRSVTSRTSHGGTSPEQIKVQLAKLGEILQDQARWLGEAAGRE
ncbi:MAG TPA: argininosuccinate lyase [Actinomycetota bacterium]|nr:argininosuccinate lyase [Actinomycetota bacterium]